MRYKTLKAFDEFLAAQSAFNHAVQTEADRATLRTKQDDVSAKIKTLRDEIGEEKIVP